MEKNQSASVLYEDLIMVSHGVWKTWPSDLYNDKNLIFEPCFLSTESLEACVSHTMGDHDQNLHWYKDTTFIWIHT